jgi:hypothetical protein
MKRRMSWALLAGGIALAASAVTAAPAAATSGSETVKGTIVTSGVSGTRTVITSVVIFKGAFSGVGRIVEVDNLPGDPDNVSRDDLVFASGTMHLVSTNQDFLFSVNPRSCVATATIHQSNEITGGTGQFTAATGSFTGTVSGPAVLAAAATSSTFRSTRWTCSQQPACCRFDDARRGAGHGGYGFLPLVNT